MNKTVILILLCFIAHLCFSQKDFKPRKMDYIDFKKDFGINDTATAVIDLFFARSSPVDPAPN